jgi:hypothetical protein
VLAQGYELLLNGDRRRIELQSWQPETARTKTASVPVEGDRWYRLKLRVELLVDGSVRARGKAWPVGQTEPSAWMVERIDPRGMGLMIGSPGLSGGGLSEVFFDNIRVSSNR